MTNDDLAIITTRIALGVAIAVYVWWALFVPYIGEQWVDVPF